MEHYTACFFGHRKIDETEELKNKLYEIIEKLIVNEKIDTFLFGSKSEFDSLCLKTADGIYLIINPKVEPQSHMTMQSKRKKKL